MPTPKITAADPTNPGLSITTDEELALREREDAAKRSALAEASAVLNRPAFERRRRLLSGGRLRWRILILAMLGGVPACDGPLPLVDAGADLAAPDLAQPDAGRSPCDDLPGGACLLCEDDRKDCRPAAPPDCLSCSWTETLNCVPSLCMEFRYEVKCCAIGRTP